ncbi:MAG: hypothetical protein JNM02_06510, partial [Anaerolineales bacterium]|nr:hypothetical protein [Anaerolineales bacterium]
MNRYLFILFIGLIITSCQSARTTTGSPTLSYTSIALAQTATPIPPTETPTITPTVPAEEVL